MSATQIVSNQIKNQAILQQNLAANISTWSKNDSTSTISTIVSGDNVDVGGSLSVHSQAYVLPTTISTSGNFTINWNLGNVFTITLTGASSASLTNPKNGASYVIVLANSVASVTLGFAPLVKWSGGTAFTSTATSNSIDVINLIYANNTYYGAFAKGMA